MGKTNKTCKVIDICVPLDVNVELREKTKRDDYTPLIDQLQRIYPTYKYQVIPVVVGALWTVTKVLKDNLGKIGIPEENIRETVEKIQKLALLGRVKICKNYQKM